MAYFWVLCNHIHVHVYGVKVIHSLVYISDMKKGKVDSWWGWMVVLAAAFNRIIIYGVTYSAGVVYVVVLDVFGDESGITSWISTLITAVMFFTCKFGRC